MKGSLLILVLLLTVVKLFSQSKKRATILGSVNAASSQQIREVNDSVDQIGLYQFPVARTCKSVRVIYLQVFEPVIENKVKVESEVVSQKHRWLTLSGNILYDLNYQSRIDTPYAENHVLQHTIQTRIDGVFKEKYPFRLYVTSRFSNSAFFRKYTDFNFLFDKAGFQRQIRQTITETAKSYLMARLGSLDSLGRRISQLRSQVEEVSQKNMQVGSIQRRLEERVAQLYRKPASAEDSILTIDEFVAVPRYKRFVVEDSWGAQQRRIKDSLRNQASPSVGLDPGMSGQQMAAWRSKEDSLRLELEKAEQLYKKIADGQQVKLEEIQRELNSGLQGSELVKKIKTLGIPDSLLPKGYKTLLAIQQLSIGRLAADYSELTVRNISITGLQLEYNPNYYYAVAVGKVDYRFRDYIITNRNRSSQFLALLRWGKGTKRGAHIFLTYYTGKRQFFNSAIAQQPSTVLPEYKLAGIAVEGQLPLGKHTLLIGEIAKSTMPFYSQDSLFKRKWSSSMTDFSNRSNEAYSFKIVSFLPFSQTRLSGNVRYTANNFQSFSTYTTGSSQFRWVARLEQPLFKKQLMILSSLQQNDYSNPLVVSAYKSSSLLASVQATFRRKKWPVLMMGYYPSYQLVKTGEQQFSESRYQTLTGSVGYHYRLRGAMLSSYAVYSRFFNSSNDSGFIYYNSRNWLFSQQMSISNWSFSANYSVSLNSDYHLLGADLGSQVSISSWLSAGAGMKIFQHSAVQSLNWGYNGSLMLKIPGLGDLQLMFDKGFIPGLNRTLVDNNTGRVTYYKIF